jgi:hypothetical protein
MFQKAKGLYVRYERWVPIVFFGLGFVFDTLMLRRIDELLTLIQQAAYLVISALLIRVELAEVKGEVHPPWFLKWIWRYREALLHFLLGTLLNSYTIFYFKSASTITSFIFIVILVAMLVLNEFKRFGESQTRVHVAFWSLCLVSYFVSLAPILLGFMGLVPFLVAMVASVAVFAGYYAWLKKGLPAHLHVLRTYVMLPYGVIQLVFVLLYFAHAIPPVPLAVQYMGIFHEVKKLEGEYELTYTRPWWRFWEHGDQTFYARPGDVVYCFARVFSPSRFADKLQVRWLYWNEKKGWESSDAIPMSIVGGREEGYRGITNKAHFQPGDWRVQIETRDNREVGRINFTIVPDSGTDAREVRKILQ